MLLGKWYNYNNERKERKCVLQMLTITSPGLMATLRYDTNHSVRGTLRSPSTDLRNTTAPLKKRIIAVNKTGIIP